MNEPHIILDTIILLDTETTGLLGPTALPIEDQPHIIEIGLLKLDGDTLEEIEEFTALIDPRQPLSREITKINGLRDRDLKGKPTFPTLYPRLVDFFLGARTLVAHNLPFDRGLLAGELFRIGKMLEFPWPPSQICTAEQTEHLRGKLLKQDALYELITGEAANQTHRAGDDIRQLEVIVRWMRGKGLL